MLFMSNQINNVSHEVDMDPDAPMHKLIDRELMQRLMQRTGTGSKVTVRQLAEVAGVPHGTIGNLLSGEQESVPAEVAYRIARRIGVDLLILFTPTGRSVEADPVAESGPLVAVQ